ncbi:MAG: hypothetical protein M3P70_05255 [Actinomycetota bacterium]|nr:hypothetical protein [Actinomycetota bacterium]
MRRAMLMLQAGSGRGRPRLARGQEFGIGSVVDIDRGGRRAPPLVRESGCVSTVLAPAAGEPTRAVATSDGDPEDGVRRALAAGRCVGTETRSGFRGE